MPPDTGGYPLAVTLGRIVKDSGPPNSGDSRRARTRPCTSCGRKLPRVRGCGVAAGAKGLAGWSGAGLEDRTVRRRLGQRQMHTHEAMGIKDGGLCFNVNHQTSVVTKGA